MKTVKTFAALAAAVSLPLACVRVAEPERGSEPATIRISIGGANRTKMAEPSKGQEDGIYDAQVFVFNSDGSLADYVSGEDELEFRAVVSPGQKDICVVANAPSLNGISTKTALLNTRSYLSQNMDNRFVMFGSKTVNITGDCEVTVEVKRIVAKIQLGYLSTDFEADAFSSLDFHIRKVYMDEVAGDAGYGGTLAPSIWYREGGSIPGGVLDLMCDDFTVDDDYIITDNDCLSMSRAYYVYPNNFASRKTCLVVTATLGSEEQRYVVDLSKEVSSLESNKVYTIEELIIKHKCPVGTTMTSVDCNITVADWETGLEPYTETL